MFALVQWIVDKTVSVVNINDVMDSKNEGDNSFVKYGGSCFMATIIRVSEDEKYLSSVHVSTDGKIMPKQKRALNNNKVEKKKLLANTQKQNKFGASRSANIEEENLLRLEPIYNDSDSNSVGESAASSSKRPRLDSNAAVNNKNIEADENDADDASLCSELSRSANFDPSLAQANKEIEALEKLLTEKIRARQNLRRKEAVRSQPRSKKTGSQRTLEYVGIVNEDDEVLGPANTETHQRTAESSSHCREQRGSQQNRTQRSTRVTQNHDEQNRQEAESNEDREEQAQLQGGGIQSPNRQHRQLEDIGERPRNRIVEDEVDHLQLCRQGGAGRVLLVEHHNVWIDKTELMYYLRWVDNPPEMARRLLRLLVGNENLIHMCACGNSKDPLIRGIPSDILRSVEYYVNKKCSSRLQPSRYITIVNNLCQTLRHPKQ